MDLNKFTIKQLRDFAKENSLILPKNLRKKKDIISFLEENFEEANVESRIELNLIDTPFSTENIPFSKCEWKDKITSSEVIGSGAEGIVYKFNSLRELNRDLQDSQEESCKFN